MDNDQLSLATLEEHEYHQGHRQPWGMWNYILVDCFKGFNYIHKRRADNILMYGKTFDVLAILESDKCPSNATLNSIAGKLMRRRCGTPELKYTKPDETCMDIGNQWELFARPG
jgi:hypothetical protein